MMTIEMARRLRKAGILLWSNEGGVTRPILSGNNVADQIECQQEEIDRLHRVIEREDGHAERWGSQLTDLRCSLDGLLTEFGLDGEAERDDKERIAALRGLLIAAPDFAAMTDGQLKALVEGPAGGSNAVAT
jgi:hypothetical protein